MKINYVTAALALLLMAGCSNDVKESDIKFAGESGAKVSFSAVINNQEASELVTRATETSWEMGDLVGITCGSRQVNIEYEYTGGVKIVCFRQKVDMQRIFGFWELKSMT